MHYCPIARHFYRLRRVLVEELGLPRDAIRPSATFAELVPREHRRRVWRRFRREEIKVNPLEMSRTQTGIIFGSVICSVILVLYILPNFWACITAAVVAGTATFASLKSWTTEIDPSYSLGDAALRMTSVRECRETGYRLTRNEIFVKVRSTISGSLGVPLSQIKRETTWEELGYD